MNRKGVLEPVARTHACNKSNPAFVLSKQTGHWYGYSSRKYYKSERDPIPDGVLMRSVIMLDQHRG